MIRLQYTALYKFDWIYSHAHTHQFVNISWLQWVPFLAVDIPLQWKQSFTWQSCDWLSFIYQ